MLNTSLPHRFGNEGATTRTHLVSVLYDLSTWNYPLLFIERIANYFDQNDLDLDSLPKIFKENFINRNILTCQLCKSKTHSFIPTYLKGLNLTHEVNKVFCGLCQSCSVELSQRIPKDINFPMSHDLLTDRLEWTNKELKF